MADWKESFKKWGEDLKAAVGDASTLSVRTFRGGVTATFDGKKWTVAKDEKAQLLAMTEISLDGDVDFFLPVNKEGAVDTALLQYHQQAVKDGSEARAAVIKGIVDVLNLIG